MVSIKGVGYTSYTISNNWLEISKTYVVGSDINFLSKNGIPEVTTTVSTTSSIPINVNYIINNISNRLDIDYIEWSFGDGTTDVKTVLKSPIIPELSRNYYSYKLIPNNLVYEPQVTIYFSNKTKYKLQIPNIPLLDLSNISVSINNSSNSTFNQTPNFNITPIQSSVLPVETKFTHIITKDLKYIIWNIED